MSYEDFTTFTEVDIAANRIEKTANHIDHLAYRNETTYLYKDYGAAHFGDFEHKIKVKAISGNSYPDVSVWALANDLGNIKALEDAGKTALSIQLSGSSPLYVKVYEVYNSTIYTDYNAGSFSVGDWIYIKIVKSGTGLTAYLYSDSDYSVLVDTLVLTLHADHSFKYLYGCNTYNDNSSYYLNTDIENFDIGEAAAAAKTRSHGYIFG